MKTVCLLNSQHFIDSQLAFQKAIDSGRLSVDSESPVYVGHYMYMGTSTGTAAGRDLFKHRLTREYLK
jgi:hypothetical protein